jgi:hypothetical protein
MRQESKKVKNCAAINYKSGFGSQTSILQKKTKKNKLKLKINAVRRGGVGRFIGLPLSVLKKNRKIREKHTADPAHGECRCFWEQRNVMVKSRYNYPKPGI